MSSEARDALILEHVPLVRFLARRLHRTLPRSVDYEELLSEGMLGLIDAVDRYDPATGNQFSTYAKFRVRGAMLDWLRSSTWLSRADIQRSRDGERVVLLVSLEDPIEIDGDLKVHDVLAGEDGTTAHTKALGSEVLRAVAGLPERQQHIVLRSICDEVPLSQIGAELGICKARVSKLRSSSIQTLQRAARAR